MNLKITAWAHRKDSANRSGRGKLLDLTVSQLAEGLLEEAARTVAKGQGTCFALGVSADGGSNDDECDEITGMLLDLDKREQFDKVPAIEEALKRNGLAYILSTRAQKAHILIPYAKPIKPPHDKAGEKAHKAKRVRVLEALGADFGVEFDPAPGKRYLGLIYPYNLLPLESVSAGATHAERSSEIETRWSDGEGLDFDAFLEMLGEAPAPQAPADGAGGPADFFAAARAAASSGKLDEVNVDEFVSLSKDDTIGVIRSRVLRQNTSDRDMQGKIRKLLAGQSWAGVHEQRDTTAQRLASWLASYTEGRGDIEAIMEVAAPSLEAMAEEQSTGFGSDPETIFHSKLVRAMGEMRRKLALQAAQLNGIANALGGAKK